MTEYAIEMDQDSPRDGYGKVHVANCRDLRDPEPLGNDWQEGVRSLGTEWEIEVDDGSVRVAGCVKASSNGPVPKFVIGQAVAVRTEFRSVDEDGIVEQLTRTHVHVRVRGEVKKYRISDGRMSSGRGGWSCILTEADLQEERRHALATERLSALGFEPKRGPAGLQTKFIRSAAQLEQIASFIESLDV